MLARSGRSLQLVLFLSGLTGLYQFPAAAEPAGKRTDPSGPLPPAAAQSLFHLAPGLRIELVASEPTIESPVAMAFDEDGKLWVVEMRDYPNGPATGQPPEGRIRVLEDRAGNGRYDHSSVFADHLLFANGLLPWKGGLVVTAAPHILYLKDTDGDGKADRRDVLYEGFTAKNPQLRVSHPLLGIDNWIYVANGLRGGEVVPAGQKGAKPINLSGMDFRFDLIHHRQEAISGLGQFGNTFDDWGRRFVCDNRNHLRHIVLPDRYVRRNPFLAVPAVLEDVSELEGGPLNSGAQIYPLSKNWTTSNLHAGRFTASCGVFIYRGQLLPKEFRGCAFTCDPTGNLVHQEVLRPNGATFRSRPPRDKVEFLATPDDWSRPVFLTHGPDGAMYVVDMYRAVIEHPEFMPPELKKRPDLLLGKEKGRIWRIVPDKYVTKPLRPGLGKATIAELVTHLTNPEPWWRTTAQRLLLERQDRAAIAPLHKLCATSTSPVGRLHAAWLLDEFAALDTELLLRLLHDDHPGVRENAVLLAERLLPSSVPIQDQLLTLAKDADARVRFQVALSLGEWDNERILPALARIALTGANDRWTRLAVASAVPKRAGSLAKVLLKRLDTEGTNADQFVLVQELATLVGSRRDAAEVADFMNALAALTGKARDRLQTTAFLGLTDGMGRRGTSLGAFLKDHPESSQAEKVVHALLDRAASVSADSKRSTAERVEGTRLLAHATPATVLPLLLRLVKEETVPEVRLAAVRSLASLPAPDIAKLLMESWPAYTPAVRREVIDAMLRQPDRVAYLLGEIEARRVQPREIDALNTRRLLGYPKPDLSSRAQRLLSSGSADRKKVIDQYRAALARTGDPKRGQETFRQNCAACHRVMGMGTPAGPDISDTRTKTAEMLLQDILAPNAAIDANYLNYQVTTRTGKLLTGLIKAETASSITLVRGEGQSDVVLRQDIEEIRSTGQSLMPEGLEKNISIEQMADLLAFLKNWRYLDGAVPLGEPAR